MSALLLTFSCGKSAYEFVARVFEAASLLVADYQAKTTELKIRYYG